MIFIIHIIHIIIYSYYQEFIKYLAGKNIAF